MNNLNSNIGNRNNTSFVLNNKGSSKKKFTGDMGNLVLICLIAFLILVLVFVGIIISIYIKTYNQNKIQDHVEEELLKYIHDCKDNPRKIPGTKIPASTMANEYSLNFWIYINGLEYNNEYNKQILMKGQVNDRSYSDNQDYPNSNPNIYIEKNTNDMVLLFEGQNNFTDDRIGGCYRTFDIVDDVQITIKETVGATPNFIKLNGTSDLERTSTSNQATTFTLERGPIEEDNGLPIRPFKIKTGFNYLKVSSSSSGGVSTEITNNASQATLFIIEDFISDNKFTIRNNPEESIPTKYLKWDTTKYTFSGGTYNSASFEFVIQNLTGTNGVFTDNENYTGEGCKSNIKKKSEPFTHFGMTRENSDNEVGYCKGFIKDDIGLIKPEIGTKCGDGDKQKLGLTNHVFIQNLKGISHGKITIKNIPIQRWTCFNVSVHDRVVDIYKDGLLYHTEILDNPPKINDYDMVLGNNGGFNGYLSRIVWSNKALSPGEIYNRYKEGPRISKTVSDSIKGLFKGSKSDSE